MQGSTLFRKVKRIEIIASKLVENLISGNYRSVFKGQGIEFDEVREYVAGDDSRLIDWNVTSRMGSPYTKIFREEREINLFLVVDLSSSIFAGSGKESKNNIVNLVSAILGISAVVNNDQVGALFFTDRIERWISPAKGRKHVLRLINDIITCKPKGSGTELGLALKTVCESLKRRGICVIISDYKATGYWNELSHIARKHDVIAVKITDPIDSELPKTGIIEVTDAENGKSRLLGGPFKGISNKYREYWKKHNSEWQQQCRKRRIQTLEINSDEDPGKKLYQFFKRRKK